MLRMLLHVFRFYGNKVYSLLRLILTLMITMTWWLMDLLLWGLCY